MSKTPRTDEQILHHDNGNGHPSDFVFASFARQLETELADKGRQFAEARAEIERKNEELDMFLAEQRAMNEIIERKNALIEQMRGALEIAISCVKEIHGEESRDYAEIKAALSAAERGE